jgi:hypothetical protein
MWREKRKVSYISFLRPASGAGKGNTLLLTPVAQMLVDEFTVII